MMWLLMYPKSSFVVRINDPLSDDCFNDPNPLPTYVISVADDDTPGFTISPAAGLLSEGNPATTTVSLVLTKAPLTNVILDIQSLDITEATVGVNSLTFTPSNWNTPQFVP